MENVNRMQEDNLKFYSSLKVQPNSRNRKDRIIEAIRLFPDSTEEQYKYVLLFEKKEQIQRYLAERLEGYVDQKNFPDIIEKMFQSKLFEIKRNHLYSIKINKENVKGLLDSIEQY